MSNEAEEVGRMDSGPGKPSWEKRDALGFTRAWLGTIRDLRTPEKFGLPAGAEGGLCASSLLFASLGGALYATICLVHRISIMLVDAMKQQSGAGFVSVADSRFAWLANFIFPVSIVPIVFLLTILFWAEVTYAYLRATKAASIRRADVLRVCAYSLGGMTPLWLLAAVITFYVAELVETFFGDIGFHGAIRGVCSNRMLFLELHASMLISAIPAARIFRSVCGIGLLHVMVGVFLPYVLLFLLIVALAIAGIPPGAAFF